MNNQSYTAFQENQKRSLVIQYGPRYGLEEVGNLYDLSRKESEDHAESGDLIKATKILFKEKLNKFGLNTKI